MRSDRAKPGAAEATIPQTEDILPDSPPATPPTRRRRHSWPWVTLVLLLALVIGAVSCVSQADAGDKLVWEKLPPIPDARYESLKGAELVSWEKAGFLLVGGRFAAGDFNEQLWLFDLEKRQWIQVRTQREIPGRMAHCALALSPGKLAVFGGIGYASGTSGLAHRDGLWLLEVRDKAVP